MTRYWDSCAESLESVMRFISVRNWSSVGVAMAFVCGVGDGAWELMRGVLLDSRSRMRL